MKIYFIDYVMPFVHETAQYAILLKTIRFFAILTIFAICSMIAGLLLGCMKLFLTGLAIYLLQVSKISYWLNVHLFFFKDNDVDFFAKKHG